MSRDPLEPDALTHRLKELLAGQEGIKSQIAALAALVHAINSALDFRLVSELPSFANTQNDYSFRYAHNQSAMAFEIKVGKLGGRAVINGIAVEDDKTRTLDVALGDYLSPSAFSEPIAPPDLASTFNSPARLRDFINQYKRTILQPLIPGLQKDGYLEDTLAAEQARGASGDRPTRAGRGGFYPDTGGPLPYGDFPPQQPGSPLRAGPSNPRPFPNVGGSDLEPLGGLAGTTGPRVPLGGLEGDGMLVGPNHPLFRDRFANEDDPLRMPGRGGPPQGPWAGDGFLPPMGAPPGARFDPVGPFTGGPRPGQGGFGNPGSRQGGGYGAFGPGGGEPDFDEALPPRGDSDYDNMFS